MQPILLNRKSPFLALSLRNTGYSAVILKEIIWEILHCQAIMRLTNQSQACFSIKTMEIKKQNQRVKQILAHIYTLKSFLLLSLINLSIYSFGWILWELYTQALNSTNMWQVLHLFGSGLCLKL